MFSVHLQLLALPRGHDVAGVSKQASFSSATKPNMEQRFMTILVGARLGNNEQGDGLWIYFVTICYLKINYSHKR